MMRSLALYLISFDLTYMHPDHFSSEAKSENKICHRCYLSNILKQLILLIFFQIKYSRYEEYLEVNLNFWFKTTELLNGPKDLLKNNIIIGSHLLVKNSTIHNSFRDNFFDLCRYYFFKIIEQLVSKSICQPEFVERIKNKCQYTQ